MKSIFTVACIFLKSVWQSALLRSTLTALLLTPLAAFAQAKPEVANATKAAKRAWESAPAEKQALWVQQREALTHLDLVGDTERQVIIDMAHALAARIQSGDAVSQAYRFAFQRNPFTKERAAAAQFFTAHGAEAFCRALLNANELLFLD